MLTKLPRQVFVPGIPAIPGAPARTVCEPRPGTPPSGSWQVRCETATVFVGWDNGPASPGNPGPFPKPIYAAGQAVCRSVWVPNPVPPQPQPSPVCIDYPAVPAVPGQPSRIDAVAIRAWDAGANSIQEIEGDARLGFTVPVCVGAIVGFTTARGSVGSPDRMSHAFVFTTSASGQGLVQVREGAAVRTSAQQYEPNGTVFEIRRIGSTVTYFRDGSAIYSSRTPSEGVLTAGCAVYSSGDQLPVSLGGDCFWEDLLGVEQVCGDAPPADECGTAVPEPSAGAQNIVSLPGFNLNGSGYGGFGSDPYDSIFVDGEYIVMRSQLVPSGGKGFTIDDFYSGPAPSSFYVEEGTYSFSTSSFTVSAQGPGINSVASIGAYFDGSGVIASARRESFGSTTILPPDWQGGGPPKELGGSGGKMISLESSLSYVVTSPASLQMELRLKVIARFEAGDLGVGYYRDIEFPENAGLNVDLGPSESTRVKIEIISNDVFYAEVNYMGAYAQLSNEDPFAVIDWNPDEGWGGREVYLYTDGNAFSGRISYVACTPEA